jgi:hypothetical protein
MATAEKFNDNFARVKSRGDFWQNCQPALNPQAKTRHY